MKITEYRTMRIELDDNDMLEAIKLWLNYVAPTETEEVYRTITADDNTWHITGVDRKQGPSYKAGGFNATTMPMSGYTEFRLAELQTVTEEAQV